MKRVASCIPKPHSLDPSGLLLPWFMVISELRALGFSVIGIEIRATLFGLDYPELDEASGLDGDIRVELPEVKGCM